VYHRFDLPVNQFVAFGRQFSLVGCLPRITGSRNIAAEIAPAHDEDRIANQRQ